MNYNVGDVIEYEDFLGGIRRGTVTAKYDEIKNGRPGFDMRPINGDGYDVWGYDSQVTRVVASACPATD